MLLAQAASPAIAQPDRLGQAMLWSYAFTYYCAHDPAETLIFEVAFEPSAGTSSRLVYGYIQSLDTLYDPDSGATFVTALYLLRTDDVGSETWPALSIVTYDGHMVSDLGSGVDSERGRRYELQREHRVVAGEPLVLRAEFAPLSVNRYETASSRAQVIRGGEPSDWRELPPAAPSLVWHGAIQGWSWRPADNPLKPVLTELFGAAGPRVVSCKVDYVYKLSPEAELEVSLPVLLMPQAELDDARFEQLLQTAKTWSEQSSDRAKGQWQVGIELFASAAALDHPLLTLSLRSPDA